MKRLTSLVCLSLVVLASVAAAAPASRDWSGYQPADAKYSQILTGNSVSNTKAAVDTVYLMGGPGRQDGKFQDNTGTLPDAESWTGEDLTIKTVIRWNVSTYLGDVLGGAGNHVIYCGELFEPCTVQDPPQGYANGYDEWFDWYGTVADNSLPTAVTVQAVLSHDSEPDYDYLYLQVERSTGMDPILTFTSASVDSNGDYVPVTVDEDFTVNAADYVGPSFDQVHLRWRGFSDSGYSDGDCAYPSGGLAVIDNLSVYFDDVLQTSDTFETGDAVDWVVAFPPSVGNFAKVWPLLADIDPCNSNFTPQFAFIDDGVVVPGTGGSPGVSWTYGPGGYIHNLTGGLADPTFHMINEIWSPPIAWPASGYDGGLFEFSVYRHMPLANGMFYVWHVRVSRDGGATYEGWLDRNLVYYSNTGDYLRTSNLVTDLLGQGRTHVQLALGVNEYGWVWGYEGTDGTPAPYFDNVVLAAFVFTGPGISSRDIDTFNDSFPAIGTIDFSDLSANSVRVDMARNISNKLHLRNDPGDSSYFDITVVRAGATGMVTNPKMYIKMKANPLFDSYRTLPPTMTQSGGFVTGYVYGDTTYSKPSWAITPDRWNFDLPDTGFFFPGDVFHYYIEAVDNVPGDNGTSLSPGDTTGFAFFPGNQDYEPLLYPSQFIVRALPTLTGASFEDQPAILFWNDFANRGGENEWVPALAALGFDEGIDYDLYYTNGPSSGVGNGLGGRASAAQLQGYTTMLYTAGDLGSFTLSNGDYNNDPGNDIGVMDSWLQQGGKNWFATGDDLEDNLRLSGATAVTFRNTWLSVTHNSGNLRPLIANQTNPLVKYIAGNAVGLAEDYIAFGGCQVFNDFDAVTAGGTSVRIAEFTSPTGATGAYPYAAAVYNNVAAYTADVVYMPVDFMFIYNQDVNAKANVNLQKRAKVLEDILLFFGHTPGPGTGVGDTPALAFSATNYPNPFNPLTTIKYTVPRAGDVSIKIYNVRGELVRSLVNRSVETPGTFTAEWDGTNDGGQAAASGVYFYRVKTADNETFNKMTLVK